MWWSDYWPMPGMFFGPVILLIFIAFCATMMWLMMRGHAGGRGNEALDILRARYARGEINQAEYEERRRLLSA